MPMSGIFRRAIGRCRWRLAGFGATAIELAAESSAAIWSKPHLTRRGVASRRCGKRFRGRGGVFPVCCLFVSRPKMSRPKISRLEGPTPKRSGSDVLWWNMMEPPEGPDSMGCLEYRSSSIHLFRVRASSNGGGSYRSSAGDGGSQKERCEREQWVHTCTKAVCLAVSVCIRVVVESTESHAQKGARPARSFTCSGSLRHKW